jgi:hypothetical protein
MLKITRIGQHTLSGQVERNLPSTIQVKLTAFLNDSAFLSFVEIKFRRIPTELREM